MSTIFGVCSDNHLHNWSAFSKVDPTTGLNDRLTHILNTIEDAAKAVQSAGGSRLYFAGDLFHVRGSVSPTVLNPAIDLFKKIASTGVECRILTGNHDLESRDSEALSSACEALRTINGVKVVSDSQCFLDDKVAMVPWFDSMDRVRKEIEDILAYVAAEEHEWTLILHAPVNGVIAGIPDHGFWAAELAKHGFKNVFVGHYHNFKEFAGGVYSVGATTHQTWSDVNTKAGYLIAKDGVVTHHESKAPKFVDFDLGWDIDETIEHCAGNYIRVRLGEATDEEITFLRDHLTGLGAKGVVVQAIPTVKTAAVTRTTAATGVTVRESISTWIKTAGLSGGADLEAVCEDILKEVEGVTV